MAKGDEIIERMRQWYSGMPHLSKSSRQWLAGNIWWLALIGVIISAMGLMAVVPALITALTLSTYKSLYLAHHYGPFYAIAWVSVLLALVSYVLTTVLLAAAVTPLRQREANGWRLLFWSYAANFALNLISMVIVLNVFGFIVTVIVAGVAGYLLFEMRKSFQGHSSKRSSTRK